MLRARTCQLSDLDRSDSPEVRCAHESFATIPCHDRPTPIPPLPMLLPSWWKWAAGLADRERERAERAEIEALRESKENQ